MTAADRPTDPTGADRALGAATPAPEPDWQRRRRLAAVFGEVLPETTADEREPGSPGEESPGDAWLRSQVPPHHG